MKNKEKANERQKKAQEEVLQDKEKDAQITKDMDVNIMMKSHENEQKDVCTEISRGHHSENLAITGSTGTTTLELAEL